MLQVHRGVKGVVKDISGEPVEGATVIVYQVWDEHHDACTFVEKLTFDQIQKQFGAFRALTFTQQYLITVHRPLRDMQNNNHKQQWCQ